MFLVSETVASKVVGMVEAIDAVERVFENLHRGEAELLPVVMGRGLDHSNLFSIKSGVIGASSLIGVKIGSYWPGNRDRGQPAHASTTILLDPATGLPLALIGASRLTALRTAASDGVSIRHLSRPDSSSLALVGAGHQAWFELLAACAVRPIRRVRIWSRTQSDALRLAERARTELGIEDCAASALDEAVSTSDIVVTVTAAREALVERHMVRPGTHISAMGADAIGKHELSPDLVAAGRLFADSVDQSISLGDFETAHRAGLIDRGAITPVGAVVAGDAPGRVRADEITIYDSSGVALQDLAVGALALEAALRRDLALRPDFLAGAPTQSNAER